MTAGLSARAVPSSLDLIDGAADVTLVLLAVAGPIDSRLLDQVVQTPLPTTVLASLLEAGRVVDEPASGAAPVLGVGQLRLDPDRVRVTLSGREIGLTHQEFKLLEAFMTHPGRVLSRAQLLHQAWGYTDWGAGRTVDVHVRRVRVKLGPEAPRIVTVRGFGYRLEAA